MSFANRSVLVTGGAGSIGSHLVEALVRDGARVTVMERDPGKYEGRLSHAFLES